MGSLSATLLGAASALKAFEYALSVTQNNIDNASTPGYAKQGVDLQADPFDPALGLAGGVSQGPLVDSRDLLAESDVWQQAALAGDAGAQSTALAAVQNALPISQGSGIPAAFNSFFSAVSAWSADPTNGSMQQNVMLAASSVAQSFNATTAAISSASQSAGQQISDTVGQINQLTGQIATLNQQLNNGSSSDAGYEAQLYSDLETLSGLANITVLHQPDGSVNVALSNGASLVVGNQSYQMSAGIAPPPAGSTDPEASPDMNVMASDGSVVNSEITSGSLAGLLQVRNETIPSLIGDARQPGALNTLASTFAKAVNSIVSQGVESQGPPPVPSPGGLFTFNTSSASAAASTLAVNPNMTASQLPAIDQNGIANGVPLALGALANSTQVALGSANFTTFYGNTAATVGSQVNQAQTNATLYTQTLAQAQSMRQTVSGVSLDAEAVNVLQFQEGYQAVAKMVTTLQTITQTVINMIP